MSAFQASQQHQTELEHVVSVTFQWITEGRCRLEVVEEQGSPGLWLLQQEMEGAPVRERSKEARAESCHPWGVDRLEGEEKGWGLSGQGIYQRH